MTYIYSIRAVLFLHSRSSVFGLTLGINVLPKTRKKIAKRLGDTHGGRVLARGVPPWPRALLLGLGPCSLLGTRVGFFAARSWVLSGGRMWSPPVSGLKQVWGHCAQYVPVPAFLSHPWPGCPSLLFWSDRPRQIGKFNS